MNSNTLRNLLKIISSPLNLLNLLSLKIRCFLYEFSNYYPCKAVGQKLDVQNNTIIIYTILGKRDINEISISELMDNQALINKFPPVQAAKFGAIALGDLLFSLPEEQRQKRYKTIKNKMLI